MESYNGADFIRKHVKGVQMSSLGELVANMFAQVIEGYDQEKSCDGFKDITAVNWAAEDRIEIIGVLACLDSTCVMSRLTVACSDLKLYLEASPIINGKGKPDLRLVFIPRHKRVGLPTEVVPDMDSLIDDARDAIGDLEALPNPLRYDAEKVKLYALAYRPGYIPDSGDYDDECALSECIPGTLVHREFTGVANFVNWAVNLQSASRREYA